MGPPAKPKPPKPKSAPIAMAVTAKRMVTEGIPTSDEDNDAAAVVDVKKTSPVKKTAPKKTASKQPVAAKKTAPNKTTAAAAAPKKAVPKKAAPKKAAPKTTKEPEMMQLSKSALSRKTVKQLQEFLQAYNVSIINDEDGKPLRKAGLLVAVQTLAASTTQ